MHKFTKKTLAVATAIALLGGGGVAFAYWTTTGAGAGTAATGTSTPVVVTQTSPADSLYPGTSVSLSGEFDNGSTAAQYVTAVTATVDAFSLQPNGAKPACTQADFSITGTSNLPGDIPAGTGVGAWSGLSINMIDKVTNQDNCKGLLTTDLTITYASS